MFVTLPSGGQRQEASKFSAILSFIVRNQRQDKGVGKRQRKWGWGLWENMRMFYLWFSVLKRQSALMRRSESQISVSREHIKYHRVLWPCGSMLRSLTALCSALPVLIPSPDEGTDDTSHGVPTWIWSLKCSLTVSSSKSCSLSIEMGVLEIWLPIFFSYFGFWDLEK